MDLAKLEALIRDYFDIDQREKELSKLKKPANNEIKNLMQKHGLKKYQAGEIEAIIKTQTKTSINEEMLLRKLQEMGLSEAIETIERPNTEAVEKMIYEGRLDPAVLADCISEKEVVSLIVKKAKRGEK